MDESDTQKLKEAKELIEQVRSNKTADDNPREFYFLAESLDGLERAAGGDL